MNYTDINLCSRGTKFYVSGTNELTNQRVTTSFTVDDAMKIGIEIGTLHIVRICERVLQKSNPNTSGITELPDRPLSSIH